jgi:hypothetical protein
MQCSRGARGITELHFPVLTAQEAFPVDVMTFSGYFVWRNMPHSASQALVYGAGATGPFMPDKLCIGESQLWYELDIPMRRNGDSSVHRSPRCFDFIARG